MLKGRGYNVGPYNWLPAQKTKKLASKEQRTTHFRPTCQSCHVSIKATLTNNFQFKQIRVLPNWYDMINLNTCTYPCYIPIWTQIGINFDFSI